MIWILLFYFLLPFFLISAAVYKDSWFTALLVILAATIAALVFGQLSFFGAIYWILANPFNLIAMIFGYLGVGAGWSIVKWWNYNRKQLAYANANKTAWLVSYNERGDAYKKVTTFVEYAKNNFKVPPAPHDHTDELISWTAFWPASIIVTFLGEYIYDGLKAIVNFLKSTYNRVTKSVFSGSDFQ